MAVASSPRFAPPRTPVAGYFSLEYITNMIYNIRYMIALMSNFGKLSLRHQRKQRLCSGRGHMPSSRADRVTGGRKRGGAAGIIPIGEGNT